MIKDTVKKENIPDAQVRSQAKFARKLAKFEQPAAPAAVKTEQLYNKSVKDKLASFEAAKKVRRRHPSRLSLPAGLTWWL